MEKLSKSISELIESQANLLSDLDQLNENFDSIQEQLSIFKKNNENLELFKELLDKIEIIVQFTSNYEKLIKKLPTKDELVRMNKNSEVQLNSLIKLYSQFNKNIEKLENNFDESGEPKINRLLKKIEEIEVEAVVDNRLTKSIQVEED